MSGRVDDDRAQRPLSAKQIVYGADFPYGSGALHTAGVVGFFTGDDPKAVDRGNVERLVPRLKA